jgi:hypothetical protein
MTIDEPADTSARRVWLRQPEEKYGFQGSLDPGCDRRIHICHAVCCRLPLMLTRQDVEEGIVEWDHEQPYWNAQDDDGYCVHLDRGRARCTVHAARPVPCRAFTCRDDPRIWQDYEAMVLNAAATSPEWPFLGTSASAAGVE